MYIADLHIHSRYSRATSKECTPEYLDLWARRKGIDLLGTGDFTHPAWRQELEEKLIPAEEGLYRLKTELQLKDSVLGQESFPRFVISGEISSIYKKNGRVRKVHNLILLPGLSQAEQLARRLEAIGNIHSDGRPILGLDSRDLLEITLEVCPRAVFVPAHIWTPHFSMFGAFSGFDTVEECFEDLSPYIHAIETGLSSDPPMNWRLSALDRFQMISNSDAHSPAKLGREANLLDISLSYEGLFGAIQEGRGLAGTIEFFPEEGKYHYDGHRKCHLCLSPREAEKYQGKCPVCGKKLTLGVSHRIEQLADREEGYVRPDGVPFESLVPLPEVIAASTGHSATNSKVQRLYGEMLAGLGNEFSILREQPVEAIQSLAGYHIGEGIRRLRLGRVRRFPGFDGEYGIIRLFEPSELNSMEGQMSLFEVKGGSGQPESLRQRKTEAWEEPGDGETFAGPQEDRTFGAPQGDRPPFSQSGLSGQEEGKRKEKETAGDDVVLNEEQLLAVRLVSPGIAVVAGPGTGKTKTLVSRILYLLQSRRVKPSEIMAVTFTNKAAQEMKTRLERQLGRKSAVKKLRIGTFHGLCHEQLRSLGEEYILAEESMALELVREVAGELGIQGSVKKLRQRISQRKLEAAEQRAGNIWENSGCGGKREDQAASELERAAEAYENRLSALGAVDFDDLLIKALETAESGLKPVPYLLVDEFQDISPLQYRLIQAWSRGGKEVFIIGDPDQAIYGFRGADEKSFSRFCQDKCAERICLRKNYRSTPEILAVSAMILKDSGSSREKKEEGNSLLEPVQKSGLPVRLVQAPDPRKEAIFVAKEINRLVGGIDMLDAQEGFFCPDERVVRSFGDIAVLYRTHRQAELLETCLKREGIPYVVIGREDFLEEDAVRASLGFFRSLLNPHDLLSRELCLKLLWKTGKDGASDCAYPVLAEKYKNLWKRGKPQKLLDLWREDMGFQENPAMEKLAAMTVFYKTMEEMMTALTFGRESDIKRWGGKHYTSDAVTLMTMHGSKGLEFPAVFVHGLRAGMVPLEYKGTETDWEEERRLLYVAMTRAKEELVLTSSGEASVFIKGLPEDILVREQTGQKSKSWEQVRQLSLFDREDWG